MKNVIFGLIGVAGLAAGANAQNLNLAVKVSTDGVNWSSNVDVLPGATVQVGIWMSGDANIYGMGGATLRLTGTGTGATAAFADGTALGRVGPFNFGAATNAIFNDSASAFRIDAGADAANANSSAGLTFFQRDPATATPGTFSQANPALCFRFDVTIGADTTGRTITMILDQLSRGVASYFTASNASRPSTAAATMTAGTIHVLVPTPASLALLGLGGLVAGRRRSR